MIANVAENIPTNILYRLPAVWLVLGRGGGATTRPSSSPRYKRSWNGTCPAVVPSGRGDWFPPFIGRASRSDLQMGKPRRVHRQTYIVEAMVLSFFSKSFHTQRSITCARCRVDSGVAITCTESSGDMLLRCCDVARCLARCGSWWTCGCRRRCGLARATRCGAASEKETGRRKLLSCARRSRQGLSEERRGNKASDGEKSGRRPEIREEKAGKSWGFWKNTRGNFGEERWGFQIENLGKEIGRAHV